MLFIPGLAGTAGGCGEGSVGLRRGWLEASARVGVFNLNLYSMRGENFGMRNMLIVYIVYFVVLIDFFFDATIRKYWYFCNLIKSILSL